MHDPTERPIREILVPTDFSEPSLLALRFAQRLIDGRPTKLHVLHVNDDPMLMQSSVDPSFRMDSERRAANRMDALFSDAERDPARLVMAIRCGTAYHEIEQYAKEHPIDLIVMGRTGHSALAEALLGSVSQHIIRHARCPVTIVNPPHPSP